MAGIRSEGPTALRTSATRGHRASVAQPRILVAFPAPRWITLRPPGAGPSPRHVGHDPAAKWISGTRPLKVGHDVAVGVRHMAAHTEPHVSRKERENRWARKVLPGPHGSCSGVRGRSRRPGLRVRGRRGVQQHQLEPGRGGRGSTRRSGRWPYRVRDGWRAMHRWQRDLLGRRGFRELREWRGLLQSRFRRR